MFARFCDEAKRPISNGIWRCWMLAGWVMQVAASGAFVTIRGLPSQVPAVAYRS